MIGFLFVQICLFLLNFSRVPIDDELSAQGKPSQCVNQPIADQKRVICLHQNCKETSKAAAKGKKGSDKCLVPSAFVFVIVNQGRDSRQEEKNNDEDLETVVENLRDEVKVEKSKGANAGEQTEESSQITHVVSVSCQKEHDQYGLSHNEDLLAVCGDRKSKMVEIAGVECRNQSLEETACHVDTQCSFGLENFDDLRELEGWRKEDNHVADQLREDE